MSIERYRRQIEGIARSLREEAARLELALAQPGEPHLNEVRDVVRSLAVELTDLVDEIP